MAVREQWEIKWIQWIAVQEDWTTVVSQADTVNIVWWWTVTDVWWVATINIPYWAEWYREDVPAGSATYTFLNSPATATSFLIFTDSWTLLFSWIDYTYDSTTDTVTFLSLWANEKAYIRVAHASVNGGGVWDMVKAVYDPNNVQQNVYDYNYFINTPTINTKAFFLEDLQDIQTAQEAFNFAISWDGENVPIIVYDGGIYLINHVDEAKWILCSTWFHNDQNNSYTERTQNNLTFFRSWDTITSISTGYGGTLSMYYLSTGTDYPTPYVPLYDGSPATKKYVDDSIAAIPSPEWWNIIWTLADQTDLQDALDEKAEWPASSVDGNIAVFDWVTGKLIRDSWLNIQVSNNPTGNPCEIYYDNGTIYLKPITPSNILLENDDNLITEDDKNIILEN